GFLLTTKRLYGRNIADSSSFVEVKDISTITLGRSGFVAAMQVHSVAGPVLSKHLSMSAQQNQEATLVFGLNQTIALLKPESTATGAAVQVENSAPTKTICTGCGATLQVGTVCKFCRRLAQQ
ncbi:MAG: hypothetical protein FWC86_05120, partial [Coriobacteriia bacterium]|nr:hypothetical protein [Coriobacteriia bacterium]